MHSIEQFELDIPVSYVRSAIGPGKSCHKASDFMLNLHILAYFTAVCYINSEHKPKVRIDPEI